MLLYCVGRDGNTADLGLGTLGIKPAATACSRSTRTTRPPHPHIYAVGDVIGYPALATTSMEQGRQAMRHAFQIPGPQGRTEVLPFAIYSIPEVAYIGETEEALRGQGADYVAGRGRYDKNPRGQITGDTGGLLKLLFERPSLTPGRRARRRQRRQRAHPHRPGVPAPRRDRPRIAEMLYNYPTLSDMYRHAALEALSEDRARG